MAAVFERSCDWCDVTYIADQRYLNRGQGRFCGKKCGMAFVHATATRPEKTGVITECAMCGVEVYRKLSQVKNSRHRVFFCSRACKDEGQSFRGNIVEIQPSHYRSPETDYRKFAFSIYPHKCKNCGYELYEEILEVNHIDCDRKNNKIENLEILCPTCHSEFHFLTKTGKWEKRTNGLCSG